MKKFSRLLALMGVACFALFMVACNNDSNEQPVDTNGNDDGANVETPANDDETTDDDIVLELWGMGSEGELLSGMVERFEAENPGIRINVTAFPWTEGRESLVTAIIAQSGPDIVQIGSTWFPQMADAGGLLDLTPHFDGAEFAYLDRDSFFEGALAGATFDGKNYGVPWYVETRVLFYRSDLLREVGFDNPPATQSELLEAATLLAEQSGYFGMDMNILDSQTLHIFSHSNGMEMVDATTRTANFADPVLIEAMTLYAEFFQSGAVSIPGEFEMDIIQAFSEGIRPMFISGPWMVNAFVNAVEDGTIEDFEWDIAVLPQGSTGNTSFLGGAQLTATAWTAHEEAAVSFINFMSNPDVQVEWFEMSTTLPSVASAWNNPLLVENDKLAVFGAQLNDAQGPSVIIEFSEIETRIVYALERIVVGGDDVAETMNRLNAEAQEILDR